MKKASIILVLFTFMVSLHASNKDDSSGSKDEKTKMEQTVINGNIMDATTGEALFGVEIKIEGTDITAYSDFDGHFEIEGLTPGKYNIIISYISYHSTLIEDVTLQEGVNSLKSIKLITN